MELVGKRLIPAPIATTWEALNDPDVLKSCIAGCESLELVQPGTLMAVLAARVGPVAARFKGTVTLSNVQAPRSYMLSFEGQGGIAGFGKGSADVSLTEQGDQTLLSYSSRVQVGGRLAQVGSRLINAAASKITEDFFSAFEARLGPATAESATPEVATRSDTDVPTISRLVATTAPKHSRSLPSVAELRSQPKPTKAVANEPHMLPKTEAAPAKLSHVGAGTSIKLIGERLVAAPILATFNALANHEVLKVCIPGIQSLDQVRQDRQVLVLAPMGPLGPRFRSSLRVHNVHVPMSFMVSFVGERGSTGLVKVSLIEEGRQTRVCYDLQAQIHGFVGKAGPRVLEFIGSQIGKQFFSALDARFHASIARMAADAGRGKHRSRAKRGL
ncbi:MAG TPA: SRPBCC domain-containing protein [Paraburkholderia sp.]